MNYLDKLKSIGIPVELKHLGQSEPVKVVCPKCSHERKKKTEPCLSVWLSEGTWNCFHCEWTGSVKNRKDEYKLPSHSQEPLTQPVISYMQGRGITMDALTKYGVTVGREYMPQIQEEVNVVQFNYYRHGTLINTKFRDGQKNFKMVSGAEVILYGLDTVKSDDYVIITEGEIDALSFQSAGIDNAISVPTGANAGKQKLDYLDNDIDRLDQFKKVYLACDADAPGRSLQKELARRLGLERIYTVSYPEGCKDANDVLINQGADMLRSCFMNAKAWPVEGVTNPIDVMDRIVNLYNDGMPKGDRIGYPEFDDHLSFRAGESYLITGVPGHGKSSFLDQIMVRLAARHGWKFGVFSAEKQPVEIHVAEITEKATGKSFYAKDVAVKMDEDTLMQSVNWVNEHFRFVNMDENDLSIDGLLEKAGQLVKREGINAFIIDNYATMEHKIPKGMAEHSYIGHVMNKIKTFKERYQCAVFMVVHPRKMGREQDGKTTVANGMDLAGSMHFFNLTDNGITVYRDHAKKLVDVHIWKVRWRFIGKVGKSSFVYEPKTGVYSEVSSHAERPQQKVGKYGQLEI